MTYPLYVAFIWHQHQPLYKSCQTRADASGQYRLPWVRLHGVKDYLDLILILERFPKLHQTVNLVPSLILQLEDYVNGLAIDPYLALTVTPEAQLTLAQKHFILEHFFDANHRTLIDPHPRYAQLYAQRQENGHSWCISHWHLQDYSDLLAWHNLAWIDPIFHSDPEIAAWLEQGKNFTLSDRQRIISKQRQILRRILPQHRLMQETGQLEIITSPYTHPILPLLANSEAGRVAVPNMTLPRQYFHYPEDISRHLQKAWQIYIDRFDKHPRGLWPSEQSVSPAILPAVAKQGFQWLCSDEGVLGWSLGHYFHRDEKGNISEPELLYRPYCLETSNGNLSMVFRDHRLSDLIGFSYSGMKAQEAATDLVKHLEAIAEQLKTNAETTTLEKPWLVTIALDGENCWENYHQDGLPFLENLYQLLSDHQAIELVTVSEYLDRFPANAKIPVNQLHSGSWIDANFTTWIGDPAKNKAWEYLILARQTLANHPEATEDNNPDAWEALYAAEGSDWFWWFGYGHSSNHDAIFDQLFREHLIALYQALNEPIPSYLLEPVEEHGDKQSNRPLAFIHPIIDGFGDEQDWDKAGRIEIGGASGTMHRTSLVQRLFFGWDHLNFYLRFDWKPGAELGKDIPPEVHLYWYYDEVHRLQSPIPLADIPPRSPLDYGYHHHLGVNLITEFTWLEVAQEYFTWQRVPSSAKASFNQCLEIAVPWEGLHIEPDARLHLIAVLANQGQYYDFLPVEELIFLQRP
ncbi:MAG: glycoside hydrolase [Microcystis aeruginosa LG13-03]|nr:glycoside hydrolase [Microcystis aeruginosa LG13-13]NCR03364.1 glycoside hydrolase [Microcystis aeruginosa LG13-03]NCR61391.1 glycoside hydrolase [Microcystis aeruginosa LG11-05]